MQTAAHWTALAALFASATVGAQQRIFDDGFDPDPTAGPGPTQTCPFAADSNGFFSLTSPASSYIVRLPVQYDLAAPRPQRLLVALHGCGDSAMNFATWAAVPWALRSSQDYIAISVGGRDGQCWNLNTDRTLVDAAIAHVRSSFYVHQRKIVLGGFSSGGLLAYKLALTNAATYAGVLIENSGLSQAVGANNVDTVLTSAAWRINVAHTARIQDVSFPIAGIRADRDKLLQHGFPLQYREQTGDHNGTTEVWSLYLIPRMLDWIAP